MSAQMSMDFGRVTPIRRVETPAARATDAVSSHIAEAVMTNSGARQKHIEIVIQAVQAHPGCTSAELTPHTGLDRVEVARRMSDAETTGRITRGIMKRCSVGGRLATTWWPADGQARAA